MTNIEFLAQLIPAAQRAMVARGVPASVTIAQGILESSWGKSALATSGCNLFGIKADKSWTGPTLDIPTRECCNGVWSTVPAKWRKYKNWGESIDDHAVFLRSNPRYGAAFATLDPKAFATAIWKAGYATDPDYPAKLMAIIAGRDLTRYDKV